MAEKLTPEATFLGGKFSDNGYAKVGVDRVLDTWEDLELDVHGLDGEETLGAVVLVGPCFFDVFYRTQCAHAMLY